MKNIKIYNLKFKDGTSDTIKVMPKFGGLNIEGYINNKKIPITPPLLWHDYALCLLPVILLVLLGGYYGALCGVIGMIFNISVIRSTKSMVKKIILIIGINLIIFILLLVMALIF